MLGERTVDQGRVVKVGWQARSVEARTVVVLAYMETSLAPETERLQSDP